MICSSENRFFTSNLLAVRDWTPDRRATQNRGDVAPSVKVDQDEINQIENYARSISQDERFRSVETSWDFWVISNELGPAARYRMAGNPDSPGLIYASANQRIWIKTWSEVLEENRGRLQFFREKLDHQADKESSVQFLRQKYAAYLEGVQIDGELLGEDEQEAA